MFGNIENLKIISSLRNPTRPYVKIESRNTHSFFIRLRGTTVYRFPDQTIFAKQGALVFIPKGSSYTAETSGENPMYAAIHFEADFEETPEPRCYSLEDFCEADNLIDHFCDLWSFGNQAEKYQCISLFYSLLSYLSAVENADYSEKKKYKIIGPAVDYLKEHIYDNSLKTETLYRLCGISNTYFRQIFISRFGTTPQTYIIAKRLAHARSIISSGDFTTIGEVALSVGFSDPLYFSKAFKKAYGISPSEVGNV